MSLTLGETYHGSNNHQVVTSPTGYPMYALDKTASCNQSNLQLSQSTDYDKSYSNNAHPAFNTVRQLSHETHSELMNRTPSIAE